MKLFITLFLVVFVIVNSFAGIEKYNDRIETSAIQIGSINNLFDTRFFEMEGNPNWDSHFTNVNVNNIVQLGYIHNDLPSTDQSTSVQVKIDWWEYGTSGFFMSSEVRTLSVSYNLSSGPNMNDKSSFVFNSAHRVRITVLNITGPVDHIYLENAMEIERYYFMDSYIIQDFGYNTMNYNTGSLGLEPTIDVNGLSEPKIEFWWENISGAEEYELEYTYISDYSYDYDIDAATTIASSELEYDFYSNSTRVILSQNHYEIPGIFNRGYVLFRVRPIGRQGIDFGYRLEGDWNVTSEAGIVSDFVTSYPDAVIKIGKNFEEDKNWVYNVSFSDDGKRFQSILYYDGIGRSRQQLAYNNATKYIAISNVYFDEIGRPVISDQPSPDNIESFSFRKDYNYIVTDIGNGIEELPMRLENYQINMANCTLPDPFSQNYGAGKYFSSFNPDQDQANAFIPDADGYPFSRVSYLGDQTGRVSEIGGFGSALQTTQNSTRIMYETPVQDELNQIFGTEVGLREHYQKITSIDPNGQAYIQYTDLAGRVIASALASNSPSTQIELDNNNGSLPKTNEVYNSSLDQDSDPKVASYSYVRSVLQDDGALELTHDFTPEQFRDVCLPVDVCFDCHYDFEITVTNIDCNTLVYHDEINMSGEQVDALCNLDFYADPRVYTIQGLDIGQYSISKTLKLSDDFDEAYWCNYIDNLDANCAPDYYTIYNDLYAAADFNCGTVTESTNDLSVCDAQRKLLAMDMAVGGQYGLVSDGSGGINLSLYPLSVYNPANVLTAVSYPWKNPDGHYKNSDGSDALLYLSEINGQYSPLPDNSANILYDVNGDPYIYPENLLFVQDFIDFAQPSWGDALVIYHPEYCYLTFCEENGSDFNSFTNIFNSIASFDEACAGGYFSPLGSTTLPAPLASCSTSIATEDVFFTTGYYSTIAQWAEANYTCTPIVDYSAGSTLNNYFEYDDGLTTGFLSIWEYAIWQASCSDETSYSNILSCINTTTLDECNKDLVWQLFKEAYLSVRYESYLFARTAYVSFPDIWTGGGCGYSYNGCIGLGFNPTPQGCFDPLVYLNTPNAPVNINLSSCKPCDDNSGAFSKKAPRFDNFSGEDIALPLGVDFTDISSVQNYADEQIDLACESNFYFQIDNWMSALSDCVSPGSQDYIDIENGFKEVFLAGCDGSNPEGASALPSGVYTISGYNSFEDVLNDVLGYETVDCSAYLISSPSPYGTSALQLAQAPLDICACDKVLEAKLDFATNTNPDITNVTDQLMANERISYAAALSLACMCEQEYESTHSGNSWSLGAIWGAASETNLLNSGIMIPTELSCNTNSCKSCSEIDNMFTSFETRFGTGLETHPNYETLLENYFNFNLGFSLNAEQYIAFHESCNATSQDPECSVNDVTEVFIDMLDVLVRRGQLISNNLDLSDNIVYANSSIGDFFSNSMYSGQVSGDDIILSFGSSTVTLSLPVNADFTFQDVISLYNFDPVPCGVSDDFTLYARVMKCGVITDRIISGTTSDFDLVMCYCGATNQELCNIGNQKVITNGCYKDELTIINSLSKDQYEEELVEKHEEFKVNYNATCSLAFDSETLTETSDFNIYQYTLFYYDQAGNLVQTVAPKGVNLNFKNSAGYSSVDNDRTNNVTNIPEHSFVTTYTYNSYNQLDSITNPDQEGYTHFWYDRYGRIIASQNPVQAPYNYSYSLYDDLGRPYETGQVTREVNPDGEYIFTYALYPRFSEAEIKQDDQGAWFTNWVHTKPRSEVTITQYDDYSNSTTISSKFKGETEEKNLRLRVSQIRYYESLPVATIDLETAYNSGIYYAYDQHGNVIEQIQDEPMMAPVEQDIKSTQYTFELISGNVRSVMYQKDELDQFEHSYYYDALNRLSEVFTSSDGTHYSRDAHYFYYDYGPLARVEIGDYKVQGSDFAYTINGWLKGMNNSFLNAAKDIGKDGAEGYSSLDPTLHGDIAFDVNAYSLGYYDGDYNAIGNNVLGLISGGSNNGGGNMYNGNIRHIVTSISGLDMMGSVFSYDQLNRLKEMKAGIADLNGITWDNMDFSGNRYYNAYSYDQNGNLTDLLRKDENGNIFDEFAYNYMSIQPPVGNPTPSNRLDNVSDNAIVAYDGTKEDIMNQSTGNYAYDKIGQLIGDASESISSIVWSYGDKKVRKILRDDADSPELEFFYNPFGQRVIKLEKPRSGGSIANMDGSDWVYTYYTYDANGKVMGVYDVKLNTSNNEARLTERNIYGASRIGMLSSDIDIYNPRGQNPLNAGVIGNTIGNKRYEITNHLGNVNVVISDMKIESVSGIQRDYLDLSSVGDRGQTAAFNPGLTNEVTLEAWVRTTASGGSDKVIAIHKYQISSPVLSVCGIKLVLKPDGKVEFGGYTGSSTFRSSGESISSINDGQWHHIAGTASGNEWRIYVDGVLESSATPASVVLSGLSSTLFIIGIDYPLPFVNSQYIGDITEISYWNTSRSAAAIQSDMTTSFTGSETGLIAYWPFTDQLSPSEDLGSGSHDISLINGASFGSEAIPARYEAVIKMTADYYPFGMTMPGRTTNYGNYRYAYNGMEQDNEVSGNGNSYTTEFRQYDPRLGRWKSLDPLMKQFPWMSPYVAFDNNPIFYIDPYGLSATNDGGPPEKDGTTLGETQTVDGTEWIWTKDGDEGNPYWAKIQNIAEVTVVGDKDFQKGNYSGGFPRFEHDNGFWGTYPEIGYYPPSAPIKPTPQDFQNELDWATKGILAQMSWLANGGNAYMHFLHASGDDYWMDFPDYFDDDASATVMLDNAIKIAKKSAQNLLTENGYIEMYSDGYTVGSDDRFPYPASEDWQKAIGGFQMWMSAKVKVVESNGVLQYSMTLTLHAEDRYNFNPGQQDIATGTPDNVNGRFELTGQAKQFNQYGKHSVHVTWSVKK